jgi:hypothetical protein
LDSIETERYTGELKIAGSNPVVSNLSIWDNIYNIRINIEVAARMEKITTNLISQRLLVQTPSMALFQIFYLPHMEYEGSIGFVSRKIKKNYC